MDSQVQPKEEETMRTLYKSLLALAALSTLSVPCLAQQYPSKPVRVVIGWPAGTGIDVGARVVTNELVNRLGQPMIIDNRPGANATIGAHVVSNSPADGYTLYYGNPASQHAVLVKNNFVDANRDFSP